MKTAIVNISRLLVALTFVVSGFVKIVDPVGTQIKLGDYAAALGMGSAVPQWLLLAAAVALAAAEATLGVMLLVAIRRRLVTRLLLAFMLCMTAVTVWIYAADPVSDCGCFGDAIHLTNGQTLAKNIVLLALTALLAAAPLRMPRMVSRTNQWIVYHYTLLFLIATAAYSLYRLPLFDFRPYHLGADIAALRQVPPDADPGEYITTFIMQKGGRQQEFTLDDYPDSTWTFVDTRTTVVRPAYEPPIHDFFINIPDEGDITDRLLADTGYVFLLVAPHFERASDDNFDAINAAYDYARAAGHTFLALTASAEKGIARWRDTTGAEYPVATVDETALQTMIRATPGLVMLHHGHVAAKWNARDIPVAAMQASTPAAELTQQDNTTRKMAAILLWFVVPLAALVIADRLWAWTKHFYKQPLNNKHNMRKKIVAGNWKMNKTLQDGVALAKELTEVVTAPNCGVIICTPFIHLATVADIVKGTPVELGAENCADKDHGAYTGEVSAEMVKSTGAQYVILGHSERRQYYNETPEILREKVQLALAAGLKVIFCIGETLEEREAGKQNDVVKAELAGSVFNLTADEWKNITVAYEPIWAIGTGKTATAEQAEEIHAYIRSAIADVYGKAVADDTTILYGGSCKASNAPELFAKPDIDGGLIGGASLKAPDFKGIIDAWN